MMLTNSFQDLSCLSFNLANLVKVSCEHLEMSTLQESCCILKGKPVFFNTSEHSQNEKLHLNYLQYTTSSFWVKKKEKFVRMNSMR